MSRIECWKIYLGYLDWIAMNFKEVTQTIIQLIKKNNCQIIDCNKQVTHTQEGHLVIHPCNEDLLIESITRSLEHPEEVMEHSDSVS